SLPRLLRPPPRPTLFPYTTLSDLGSRHRSRDVEHERVATRHPHRLAARSQEEREIAVLAVDLMGNRAELVVGRLQRQDKVVFGSDRKSTRLNSSHVSISYAGFCLK